MKKQIFSNKRKSAVSILLTALLVLMAVFSGAGTAFAEDGIAVRVGDQTIQVEDGGEYYIPIVAKAGEYTVDIPGATLQFTNSSNKVVKDSANLANNQTYTGQITGGGNDVTFKFTVETVRIALNAITAEKSDGTDYVSNKLTNMDVTMTARVTANAEKLERIEYSADDGGTWTVLTNLQRDGSGAYVTLTVDPDVKQQYKFHAISRSGTVGGEKNFKVNIDKNYVDLTTEGTLYPGFDAYASNVILRADKPAKFSYKLSLPAGGSVEYTGTGYAGALTLNQDGDYSNIYAVDKAGNRTDYGEVIMIRKTTPTLTVTGSTGTVTGAAKVALTSASDVLYRYHSGDSVWKDITGNQLVITVSGTYSFQALDKLSGKASATKNYKATVISVKDVYEDGQSGLKGVAPLDSDYVAEESSFYAKYAWQGDGTKSQPYFNIENVPKAKVADLKLAIAFDNGDSVSGIKLSLVPGSTNVYTAEAVVLGYAEQAVFTVSYQGADIGKYKVETILEESSNGDEVRLLDVTETWDLKKLVGTFNGGDSHIYRTYDILMLYVAGRSKPVFDISGIQDVSKLEVKLSTYSYEPDVTLQSLADKGPTTSLEGEAYFTLEALGDGKYGLVESVDLIFERIAWHRYYCVWELSYDDAFVGDYTLIVTDVANYTTANLSPEGGVSGLIPGFYWSAEGTIANVGTAPLMMEIDPGEIWLTRDKNGVQVEPYPAPKELYDNYIDIISSNVKYVGSTMDASSVREGELVVEHLVLPGQNGTRDRHFLYFDPAGYYPTWDKDGNYIKNPDGSYATEYYDSISLTVQSVFDLAAHAKDMGKEWDNGVFKPGSITAANATYPSVWMPVFGITEEDLDNLIWPSGRRID